MTDAARLLVVLFAGLAGIGVALGIAGLALSRSLRANVEYLRGELAVTREDLARAQGEGEKLRAEDNRKAEQIRVLTDALATGPDIEKLVDEIRAMASAVVGAVSHQPPRVGRPPS